MGRRRKRVRQEGLWTPTAALPMSASHPFYQRLNRILDEKKFDEYVEDQCQRFYAGEVGRPGLAPAIYFRLLMVGYFEGIDSETRNRVASQRQPVDPVFRAHRTG